MELEKTSHISVMKKEVLEMLRAKEGGVFLDCTLGGAGHTKAILDANKENKVFAIDRDENAIKRAKEFLKGYEDRVKIFNAKFSEIPLLFSEYKFNGVLADLGLSTDQLKEQRGFSFNDDTFLDMRMGKSEKTAYSIINETEYKELFVILKVGGVGKEASLLAKEIIKHRPISTAKELANVMSNVLKKFSASKTHLLSLPFQAIRIAVNNEFEEIKNMLESVPKIVAPHARLVVICFHSLEDKIVTSKLRMWQRGEKSFSKLENFSLMLQEIREKQGLEKDNLENDFENKGKGTLLTKKALVPQESEILENPASRSSLMRVFEFK